MSKLRMTSGRGLIALAGCVLIAGVNATDEPGTSDADLARFLFVPVFDILDCTQQGFIEAGEIDEHLPILFNPLSRGETRILGRDAFVTSEDADEAALQEQLFETMDGNHDELVSAREFRDTLVRLLDEMDSNGDDEITMDELQFGSAAVVPAEE